MPSVCSEAVLLLETSGGSDKLVDEKTARKYTLGVVAHLKKPKVKLIHGRDFSPETFF